MNQSERSIVFMGLMGVITMQVTRSLPADGTNTKHRHEIDSKTILLECCEAGASCRVMFVHDGQSLPALFESAEGGRVQIRIGREDSANGFVPHALVCISFPHQGSLCAFFACIVDVCQRGEGGTNIFVERPARLTVVNLRQSFRVPVVFQSGLRVEVRVQGHPPIVVDALNVAETGIEFEFAPADIPPGLEVGTPIELVFRYHNKLVEMTGDVKRSLGGKCAVMLTNSTSAESQTNDSQWHDIVASLQQLWLKSRLR